jgi:Flp pilus assembly pilin Flp
MRSFMDTSAPTRVSVTLIRFWNDDDGLVTLEWIGLAAAVIVLAVGVISIIQSQLNTAAGSFGSKATSTQLSQSDQPDSARGQCSAPGLAVAADHANNHASPCQAR